MKAFYSYSFDYHQIFQTPNLWQTYQNYNYMIVHNKEAWIFDPGEFGPLQNTLKSNQLILKGIYLTHHHRDHVGAAEELAHHWKAPIFGFKKDQNRLPPLTQSFEEGEELKIASLQAQILFLPGHTLGLCAFYFPEKKWLFSNDLLFSLGCGRVFEGSYVQMFQSLNHVRVLPKETLIFSSHEYTLKNLEFCLSLNPLSKEYQELYKNTERNLKEFIPSVPTTLEFEKKHNPFLRWDDHAFKKSIGLDHLDPLTYFSKIRELRNQF